MIARRLKQIAVASEIVVDIFLGDKQLATVATNYDLDIADSHWSRILRLATQIVCRLGCLGYSSRLHLTFHLPSVQEADTPEPKLLNGLP